MICYEYLKIVRNFGCSINVAAVSAIPYRSKVTTKSELGCDLNSGFVLMHFLGYV